METLMPTRPNVTAAVAAGLARFDNWLQVAQPADTYTYHTGLLAADRWEARYSDTADLTFAPVEPFHSVGLRALGAAEDGLVTLWQRRIGVAEYEYLARRTAKHVG